MELRDDFLLLLDTPVTAILIANYFNNVHVLILMNTCGEIMFLFLAWNRIAPITH